MRKSIQLFNNARESILSNDKLAINDSLWSLIMYSPKFSMREHQKEIINNSKQIKIKIFDRYFSKKDLSIDLYSWGEGDKIVLLTHGWGSKAADYSGLIISLLEKKFHVISFDAPGNGNSEGEFSCLPIFIETISEVTKILGKPDIFIGHSLGAMANVLYLAETGVNIRILISIAPIINLKDNFERIMNSVQTSINDQQIFLESFKERFNRDADYYDFIKLYAKIDEPKHFLIYDENDTVTSQYFINEFLTSNKNVEFKNFPGIGHENLIKNDDIINYISKILD